ALSFDAEFIGIEFVFFDQRALDRFRSRQTEVFDRLSRDPPLHARIGMTFDEDDSARELTGKAGNLLERSVDVGIIELSRDRLIDIVARRLVRIGGIRKEVNAYRLCQDRRFGRRFTKASRRKGSDALIRLMSEGSFFLESLDD